MNRFPACLAAILVAASCGTSFGEVILTAEVIPLSGLDGFSSYRITATSDLGNVVGFDFSKVSSYGITGPMSQQSPFGQSTVFSNQIFGDADASLDSQFLFNSNDVVNLFSEETSDSLHSVFAVGGDRQLTIGNSVPFVQIATSSAQEILLKGSFVIRRPNDEMIEHAVSVRLSDIQVGAAPHLDVLPIPPPAPPPIAPPVTVLPPPPVVNPPVVPVVEPPAIPVVGPPNDPVVAPIAPVVPPPVTPSVSTTIPSSMVSPNNLLLSAEKVPIAGMPGYNSFRITASSDLGNIVCFDFSKVGQYGINGPINQINPLGQATIFRDQMFGDSDPLQDTQFLLNSSDVVQLFPEESSESLNAIFAVGGEMQQTIGNSVPFVQIATAEEANVTLKGSFAILRPDGQILETAIDVKLTDVFVGAAPTLEILPVPQPEPVAIVPPAPSPPESYPTQPEPITLPPEPTTAPVETEPQPPQVWVPSPEQITTFEPPPVAEPPQFTLPEVTPGEGLIITGWPVYDPTYVISLPWIDRVPIDPTTIDTTIIAIDFDYFPLLLENPIGMMLYDDVAGAESSLLNGSLFVSPLAISEAQTNSFLWATSPAWTRNWMDANQSLAEVPEPASSVALMLGAFIAVGSRMGGLRLQRTRRRQHLTAD